MTQPSLLDLMGDGDDPGTDIALQPGDTLRVTVAEDSAPVMVHIDPPVMLEDGDSLTVTPGTPAVRLTPGGRGAGSVLGEAGKPAGFAGQAGKGAPAAPLYGVDLLGEPITSRKAQAPLAKRWIVPPFTVLDARAGEWQERKRAWLALGIRSEIGRGMALLGLSEESEDYRKGQGNYAKGKARAFSEDLMKGEKARDYSPKSTAPGGAGGGVYGADGPGGFAADGEAVPTGYGTSIFDPVLSEVAYAWFCPPGGTVLDPFAGGSVRGIVASLLGRHYVGIDLRDEQVQANYVQADAICEGYPRPRWIVGDSANPALWEQVRCEHAIPPADFLWTCPPYGDLEVYSDDPRDLSTMPLEGFAAAYRQVIANATAHLQPDRFAGIVVGDYRDKKTGCYVGFPVLTIDAFQRAGLRLYNEAVLLTAVGSLPIRVSAQFPSGRKLGKSHQNVLLFVKGDPKKAAAACDPMTLESGLLE